MARRTARITISLPFAALSEIKAIARKKKQTEEWVIRDALAGLVGSHFTDSAYCRAHDLLFPDPAD